MSILDSITRYENRNLEIAVHAAMAGGGIIRNEHQQAQKIRVQFRGTQESKNENLRGLVSQVHLEAEKAILAIIRRGDPASHIISKENPKGAHTESLARWTVNPLDGTSAVLFGTDE